MLCARGRGPPLSAGGHCRRPWQHTRRRCPKRQPSWLPAWRETHKTARQVINDGKKQSAAGCRGKRVTAPACSPRSRDAFFISSKEIPPMETLCSSGPPGSLLPHLCLSKDRRWQGSDLQEGGSPGGDRPGGPSTLAQGREWLGCRFLGRTRSALRELLAHHSHQ